ncbi:MAG TPA: hypothetical protein VGJ90_11565 [Methylophilaceae bacterium]|jgi:hypothetical protein
MMSNKRFSSISLGVKVMESLISILQRAINTNLEKGWLYLPRNQEWNMDTSGFLLDIDELEDNDSNKEAALLIAKQNLVESLDNQTIEDVSRGAKGIENPPSDSLLLEAFLYYYKYDAFLPKRGYMPTPSENFISKIDREFFDLLGNESLNKPCQKEGCFRGRVTSSMFCRVHHFEMVKGKPCPFTS